MTDTNFAAPVSRVPEEKAVGTLRGKEAKQIRQVRARPKLKSELKGLLHMLKGSEDGELSTQARGR